MRTIASRDVFAFDLLRFTRLDEGDAGRRAVQGVEGDIGDIEKDRPTGGKAGLDEVFDHLMLAVDGDGAAGEGLEIDAVGAALELEFNAAVDETFAAHAVAEAAGGEEIGRVLLEDAGANALFETAPRSGFNHDRVDAFERKEVREKETGGSRADDGDLGANCSLIR